MTRGMAEFQDRIVSILPAEPPGMTPRAILAAAQEKAGNKEWTLVTTRHAMRDLVAAGRVTFDGPDGSRLYRRAP